MLSLCYMLSDASVTEVPPSACCRGAYVRTSDVKPALLVFATRATSVAYLRTLLNRGASVALPHHTQATEMIAALRGAAGAKQVFTALKTQSAKTVHKGPGIWTWLPVIFSHGRHSVAYARHTYMQCNMRALFAFCSATLMQRCAGLRSQARPAAVRAYSDGWRRSSPHSQRRAYLRTPQAYAYHPQRSHSPSRRLGESSTLA